MALETFLPALDASLILTSGLLLLVGFGFIKRKKVLWHKRSMLGASVLATLFLIVYVIRWGLLGSRPFEGRGGLRAFYFTVLISHMVLAGAIIPLVGLTLRRALRGDFPRHKRIARITLPLWLYVALTGWVVYWLLYHSAP